MLELRTSHLLLRPLGPEDEESLFRLLNEPRVRHYLCDDLPVSREMVQEHLAHSQQSFRERGFGLFSLFLKEQPGTFIGFTGLGRIDGGEEVEVWYALAPEHWGRGLATEAAEAMLRFGFEQLGLKEIWAGADLDNAASFRVMERLGMTRVGERIVGPRQVRALYYRRTR
ncbi:GNAT family N-acetyltransferase [Archangium violaceum]|uniref:GNAT family N-acetyltransferase n=1 Tax=Archangium violaceum TaxID=83451 RepID=UPI002B2B99C7|nr:GNAT family N-acetyltransferase [Archangium violaceum]